MYCGTAFPAELKKGFPEPDTLKWVERPGIPPEAARQLELLKVIPDEVRRPRSLLLAAALLSVPLFGAVFYMLHRLVARYSAAGSVLVLLAGGGFLAYLVWTLLRSSRT